MTLSYQPLLFNLDPLQLSVYAGLRTLESELPSDSRDCYEVLRNIVLTETDKEDASKENALLREYIVPMGYSFTKFFYWIYNQDKIERPYYSVPARYEEITTIKGAVSDICTYKFYPAYTSRNGANDTYCVFAASAGQVEESISRKISDYEEDGDKYPLNRLYQGTYDSSLTKPKENDPEKEEKCRLRRIIEGWDKDDELQAREELFQPLLPMHTEDAEALEILTRQYTLFKKYFRLNNELFRNSRPHKPFPEMNEGRIANIGYILELSQNADEMMRTNSYKHDDAIRFLSGGRIRHSL